ncbi:glycosyltransferase [Inhella gelatinilytica]|uniref:Glycosyltransferase n=1 Tax=Inhella gelatinilytica TaxID=2795030 RepID=A0A931NEK5_9BURK|nr:glycosyltransferase [Inhella gelatinilytica]MBH9553325.1 glycosyltransferase [Inhella gelatinilytica]
MRAVARPRVALHDYRTDPLLPQKDGVNLAHENIAALLRSPAAVGLDVRFHDLLALLRSDDHAAEALADVDCVVANVGPHAHYYLALRERLGLRYRVIRDVRTAMWSSYLLQEHLCAPLLREGDVLMVASVYTQSLYRHFFPHLAGHPLPLCYPLTVGFPASPPARVPDPLGRQVLGYLGRLSEDKNFPDLVQLLIALERRQPGRHLLLACGDVHSASCHPERVRAALAEQGVTPSAFEHCGALPNAAVWGVLGRMDVMLFPSTSNLETLGRVLIEASFAGIPVIGGQHAAAPELVPGEALVPVHYHPGLVFDTHHDHSLGHLSGADLLAAVEGRQGRVPQAFGRYQAHAERFLALVAGQWDPDWERLPEGSPPAGAGVERWQMRLPPALTAPAALEAIDTAQRWFLDLHDRSAPTFAATLQALQALSAHPERTQRFLQRLAQTRGDFTNVGAIDIELCGVMRFWPEVRQNFI